MNPPASTDLASAMNRAVLASYEHVRSGGLPFVGVLILDDGTTGAPGHNQVAATGDPSAHAEIVAMRAVLDSTGAPELSGATLLATGEPCALCYRFATTHRIDQVYYAVSEDTAAAWGFDYRTPHGPTTTLQQTAKHLPTPGAIEPFRLYHQLHHPTRPHPQEPS